MKVVEPSTPISWIVPAVVVVVVVVVAGPQVCLAALHVVQPALQPCWRWPWRVRQPAQQQQQPAGDSCRARCMLREQATARQTMGTEGKMVLLQQGNCVRMLSESVRLLSGVLLVYGRVITIQTDGQDAT